MSGTARQEHEAPRRVVVTGATSGIGEATATLLVARGHDVFIGGLTEPEVDAAVQRVVVAAAELVRSRAPGAASRLGTVWGEHADLSDPSQLDGFARAIRGWSRRLDVIIHNAGLYPATRRLSVDGVELTWAVNLLAPVRLTYALAGVLHGGRVIALSSNSHPGGRIHWQDPSGPDGFFAYAQSKAAVLMWAQRCARSPAWADTAFHAVHPGVISTGIGSGGWVTTMMSAGRRLLRTPADAARMVSWAALDPDGTAASGGYSVPRAPTYDRSSRAGDLAGALRLGLSRVGRPGRVDPYCRDSARWEQLERLLRTRYGARMDPEVSR